MMTQIYIIIITTALNFLLFCTATQKAKHSFELLNFIIIINLFTADANIIAKPNEPICQLKNTTTER